MRIKWLVLVLFSSWMPIAGVLAEEITVSRVPDDRLLTYAELIALLDPQVYGDKADLEREFREDPEKALKALAEYLRAAYAQRYYVDWRNAPNRFADYRRRFPEREVSHRRLAAIHTGLYPAAARWKLPYRNLLGDEVTAYELRHLARQHKVLDMAFVHHYDGGAPAPVDYFSTQMRSLNAAFEAGEFEDDNGGNGVYESFRAGYRVMNWLQIHALFLGSESYDWRDQLDLVRSLLHTAAILQRKNVSFRYGNHQTRGVVALAMVAILFRDFSGTRAWYDQAMSILGQHLEKEVNADGFQFERSVHYHVGDIYNYFQVMQLAQLNNYPVPPAWRGKLESMFDAAVTLARPDRHLPVLQDDTDRPWAEYNEMGDFMLLGSMLFNDPVYNYFAGETVAPAVYWWLRDEQIAAIGSLERQRPALGSDALPDTGYYVMRDGWAAGDHHLVISAGLSAQKPDHQHGDMLGLVAHANGQEILPNYQVRYSLPDYEHFKNSLVKNVAMVDGLLQGRGWKSNKGGSGFGKWERLPSPEVITWLTRDDWDFFAGTHDGYADLGVEYVRKVLFLKGLGWIVRDVFESSSGEHRYQQVWQGHYSPETDDKHHRATFADGSGLDVLQLGRGEPSWAVSSRRGKGNLIYTLTGAPGEFTTLLYPFDSFGARIQTPFSGQKQLSAGGWTLRTGAGEDLQSGGLLTDAAVLVERAGLVFALGASRVSRGGQSVAFGQPLDLALEIDANGHARLLPLEHEAVEYTLRADDGTNRRGRIDPEGGLLLSP
jgi:hypothetical protein